MDIKFLLNYIDVVTLGICLCIGYAIKHAEIFEKIGNRYIPLSMLVVGVLISIATNAPNINATVFLGGMISGLASTGLYEMMRNLLNRDGKDKV